MPRFYTYQDSIHIFYSGRIIRCLNRLNNKIAFNAFDSKTRSKQCLQVLTTGNEGYIFTGLCQATSKVSSNTTSSKNYGVHKGLPAYRYQIVSGFENCQVFLIM